jgi:hypothetical protein
MTDPAPSPGSPLSPAPAGPRRAEIGRAFVPGVPFAVSLALSIGSVGAHPFWQDSGTYLTAVKELGVLYPPGFVLYELLCRIWTGLFFFLDFTLAVHLFSAACAALAAGAMAAATRELLRSSRGLIQMGSVDAPKLADGCAMLSGVLLAGGFTFWSGALLAKGYALYLLILCLLLWRIIRADESRRPRDFLIVAALTGLAWQAHPSSVLIGVALLLFVAVHARSLGLRIVMGGVGLAAGCALGPTFLLLPLFLARDPWLKFGHPGSLIEVVRYLAGHRFVGPQGTFGVDPSRVASVWRYAWEDTLGIGLLLMIGGVAVLARRAPRLLVGMALWTVPYTVVTVLFKMEGQHDFWLLAARLPLYLALGVGAYQLGRLAGQRSLWGTALLGLAGTVWAVVDNYRDVEQRDYLLPEAYGKILLETPDPQAIVLLSGDDANSLAGYLQRVRGERPDLTLVTSSFLPGQTPDGRRWYLDDLIRRSPFLVRPEGEELGRRFPQAPAKTLAVAAFVNANAGLSRPVFLDGLVPPEMLRPDLVALPAGVYWKIVPRSAAAGVDPRYWRFPVEPEQVRPQYRRARGQFVAEAPGGISVKPESYERRLAVLILRARIRLAHALTEQGQFARAARLCQSVINYDDPEIENNPEVIHLLGISYYAAGELDRAEPALELSARSGGRAESRATALFYLGEIRRKRGDPSGARRYFDQAVGVPGLDPAYVREMESRMKTP